MVVNFELYSMFSAEMNKITFSKYLGWVPTTTLFIELKVQNGLLILVSLNMIITVVEMNK